MCHKNNFNRDTPTSVSKAIVLMTILYSPQRLVTYPPTCACQSNYISAVAHDPQHSLDGKQHRTNSTSDEHTRPSFEAEWPILRLCSLRRATRTKDYRLPKASPHRELLSGHRDKGVRRERQKDALKLKGTRLADAWAKAIGQCKQIIVRLGETASTMLSLSKIPVQAVQNRTQNNHDALESTTATTFAWLSNCDGVCFPELSSSLTKVDVIYIDLHSLVMFTLRSQDIIYTKMCTVTIFWILGNWTKRKSHPYQ